MERVWPSVTCGLIIRDSAGASRCNTTGEPLMPACMLASVGEVKNAKCQKLNRSDVNLKQRIQEFLAMPIEAGKHLVI